MDIDRLLHTRRYYALLSACGALITPTQQVLYSAADALAIHGSVDTAFMAARAQVAAGELKIVNGLVAQELEEREADLTAAMTALEEHAKRWHGSQWLVVADSSFFLNSSRPLAETDVNTATGLPAGEDVLLLFPIVVVDELDRLKESGSAHPRWRAGHTLGRLDEAITSGTTGELRPRSAAEPVAGQITVEIVMDAPGHVRQSNADDEIIERAAAVQAIAGRDVRLLTCDTGQATRGRIAGLKVTKLPSRAGTGAEPPRPGAVGDQPRGTGLRAQQKNRAEAANQGPDTRQHP
ncbi:MULTISPECIES: PIN domain-containing protein [unclassified Streptomyces]|uniref:PIN domain-containing protein n=1 Tax=unclassified Streptomyces TaxID=2593676 RepID=UPI001C628B70|nr:MULTISPECIES: PIN domain-containing protein [unclassified Streptomyces]